MISLQTIQTTTYDEVLAPLFAAIAAGEHPSKYNSERAFLAHYGETVKWKMALLDGVMTAVHTPLHQLGVKIQQFTKRNADFKKDPAVQQLYKNLQIYQEQLSAYKNWGGKMKTFFTQVQDPKRDYANKNFLIAEQQAIQKMQDEKKRLEEKMKDTALYK